MSSLCYHHYCYDKFFKELFYITMYIENERYYLYSLLILKIERKKTLQILIYENFYSTFNNSKCIQYI